MLHYSTNTGATVLHRSTSARRSSSHAPLQSRHRHAVLQRTSGHAPLQPRHRRSVLQRSADGLSQLRRCFIAAVTPAQRCSNAAPAAHRSSDHSSLQLRQRCIEAPTSSRSAALQLRQLPTSAASQHRCPLQRRECYITVLAATMRAASPAATADRRVITAPASPTSAALNRRRH